MRASASKTVVWLEPVSVSQHGPARSSYRLVFFGAKGTKCREASEVQSHYGGGHERGVVYPWVDGTSDVCPSGLLEAPAGSQVSCYASSTPPSHGIVKLLTIVPSP
jgi:hypothetical protein